MKGYVYILECANGRYYVGSTISIEDRLTRHQSGRVKATKHLLPVRLLYNREFETIKEARQEEYAIKTKKSRVFIERYMKGGEISLKNTIYSPF